MYRQAGYREAPDSVSILVFVELALDADCSILRVPQDLQFQSLFSWNLLLMKKDNEPEPAAEEPVSILVFVELALDVLCHPAGWYENLCFNPCFRGTCS